MRSAVPRLALAPLFLLWFGLGLASKIAVGTSLGVIGVLLVLGALGMLASGGMREVERRLLRWQ